MNLSYREPNPNVNTTEDNGKCSDIIARVVMLEFGDGRDGSKVVN